MSHLDDAKGKIAGRIAWLDSQIRDVDQLSGGSAPLANNAPPGFLNLAREKLEHLKEEAEHCLSLVDSVGP